MSISTYLNQTVTKKTTAEYDLYGKPIPELSTSIKCRIQSSSKKLVGDNGIEFIVDAEMWIKPTDALDTDDVITWGGNDYKVIKVDSKRDLTGSINHKKCYLVINKE